MQVIASTRRRDVSPRLITMTVAGAATFALLLAMMLLPVPFGVQAPGPTVDTLGESHDAPLISVEGAQTYPTDGQLRLTTVTTAGGPDYPVGAGQVVQGWLSSSTRVAPIETFYDPNQTQQQIDDAAAAQMTGSQENATVAALTELGYDVPATLTVVGSGPGSGAEGIVDEGDVIRALVVDGTRIEVETFDNLSSPLLQTPAGSAVQLVVDRDGAPVDLDIVTGDDGYGGSLLGVYLAGDFDYPVDVQIQIDNIGGPSAGTMFALGIIDLLTPGDLTGGHVVAGTGTISLGGLVGPIGGIQQKMVGAIDAGAEYFLAPEANCDEVVGHVPDGLQVISVRTLADATDAAEAIGAGDTATLPGCG